MDDTRGHQKTVFSHLFLALVSCTWRLRRWHAGMLAQLGYRLLLHFEVPHGMPRRFRIERDRWGHRLRERIMARINQVSRLVEGFVEGDEAYRVVLTADEHTPMWGYQMPKAAYGIVELPRKHEPNLVERSIQLHARTPIEKMRVIGHRLVDGRLHVDIVWLTGQAIGQTFTVMSSDMFRLDLGGMKTTKLQAAGASPLVEGPLPFRIYKQSHMLTTLSLGLLSLMAVWLGSAIAAHASQLVRR